MDEKFQLTPKQKNSLHDAVADPMLPPAFALSGDINPKMRVFVVHFDGTQNDKDNIQKGTIATLVANSHDNMSTNENLTTRYYSGVGTKTSVVRGILESVTGMGAQNRAERAYEDLCEQTKEWRKTNPECEVHVHVVGFSRGSGIGLHFMNLVHERGIKTNGKHRSKEEGLMPGQVKTSAVLFDAVTTGNANLKLTLPDSNVATLHITAGAEERMTFPLTSLKDERAPDEIAMVSGIVDKSLEISSQVFGYQRLREITLEGARHSDVGGSYPSGGIRQVSGYLMGEFQRHLGLPVHTRKPSFEEIEEMHANDSRFLINKIVDPFLTEEEQLEARQTAQRTVISRGERAWDGDVAIKCSLKDGDGESLGFIRHEHCKMEEKKALANLALSLNSIPESLLQTPGEIELRGGYKTPNGNFITQDQFSSINELTLKKASADTPAEQLLFGLEVVGAKPNAFGLSADGKSMTYHGMQLPSQFSPETIQAIVEESTNNQVTLCVGMEKTTPVFNVGHQAMSRSQVQKADKYFHQLGFQDDPWPAAVCDILYKLNDPNSVISNRDANMMTYAALESMSSRILMNYGEHSKSKQSNQFIHPDHRVKTIGFRSDVIGNQHGKFHIEITRVDGSKIRDTDIGNNAEDFVFLTEMKSIQKAMDMINEKLHRAGHLTNRPIHQIFSKEREWDLSSKTMPDKNFREITAKEFKQFNDTIHNLPAKISFKSKNGDDLFFVPAIKQPMPAIPGMSMVDRLSTQEAGGKDKRLKMLH